MADKPFDREVINQRERPLSSDVNTGWSYADQTARYVTDVLHRWRARNGGDPAALTPLSGFVGDSFRVIPASPAAMQVVVSSGLGYYVDAAENATDIGSGLTPGVLGVDDNQRMHPLPLSAAQALNVPAADPVNPRIDIVEVKLDRRLQDPTSRQILDPATGLFSALAVNKTLAFDLDGRTGINTTGGDSTTGIAYKTGVAAGAPVAPATSTGYVKIAEVYVGAAVTTLAEGVIRDTRTPIAPDNAIRVSARAQFSTDGLSVPSNAGASTIVISAPAGLKVAIIADTAAEARLLVFGGFKAGTTATGTVTYWGDNARYLTLMQFALQSTSVADATTFLTDTRMAPNVTVSAVPTGQNYMECQAIWSGAIGNPVSNFGVQFDVTIIPAP